MKQYCCHNWRSRVVVGAGTGIAAAVVFARGHDPESSRASFFEDDPESSRASLPESSRASSLSLVESNDDDSFLQMVKEVPPGGKMGSFLQIQLIRRLLRLPVVLFSFFRRARFDSFRALRYC